MGDLVIEVYEGKRDAHAHVKLDEELLVDIIDIDEMFASSVIEALESAGVTTWTDLLGRIESEDHLNSIIKHEHSAHLLWSYVQAYKDAIVLYEKFKHNSKTLEELREKEEEK